MGCGNGGCALNADVQRTPHSRSLLAATLLAGAFAIMAISLRAYPFSWTLPLVLVMVCTAISEVFSFELAGISLSLAYPLVMCVIVLCGPAASGIAAACTAVSLEDIRQHRPLPVLVFNIGQLVIASCCGGWMYILFGGRVLQSPSGVLTPFVPGDFPKVLYGMMAAAVVYVLINLALVSIGVGVFRGASMWRVAVDALPVLPAHIALPFVGFLMAQVLSLSVVALPLFIFPLLVARQLYQRYVGLSSAYADTIRSLIGALEAKDPYTRGHSERVSAYAAALGIAMGLDSRALERLEYAALLHDLGKLAVPAAVLSKPARLEPDEMERIRQHPAAGAEMVRRIPPLRDLAETVHQHHERINGTGYPLGIDGSEMSVAARILAVADCYDAMTTTRAYRPALSREQAIAELIDGSDHQFDAAIVQRFIEARVGEDEDAVAAHVLPSLPVHSSVLSKEG